VDRRLFTDVAFVAETSLSHDLARNLIYDPIARVSNTLAVEVVCARSLKISELFLGDSTPLNLPVPVLNLFKTTFCMVGVMLLDTTEIFEYGRMDPKG